MLVILSFALVLVATVLLVLGLLQDGGLTLIYFSIGCSAAAAIVLVIAVRTGRSADRAEPPIGAPQPAPVGAPPPPAETTTMAQDDAAPAPEAAPVPASTRSDEEWLASDQDEWSAEGWTEGQEVEFPIADYDDLTSRQILPLLPQLYADELDIVEERERLTKARPEILERVAELRGTPSDAPVPTGAGDAPVAGDALGGHVTEEPPVPPPAPVGAEQPAAASATPAKTSAAKKSAKKAATKKTAAKKAATKKAATKKTAAKKAPAKKAATKKAATKKAAAKKAPAKKAATKKAPAKKAAAKKAAKRSR